MPVGIGGVGDIIAIIGLVREFATALDGTRGSAAEYQEVRRELDGLEKALLCHHQLLQARCDDPALNDIFRSTQSTAEDCQKCIEAFSQQTVKFDRSLAVDPSGNIYRDVMMKVRWQMSKKEEVARLRVALGQHISSLNVLLILANVHMQRATQDKIDSKLDILKEKIDSNSKAHEVSIMELQKHIEKGNTQSENAVKSIQEYLKRGWLRHFRSELKGVVSQIFTMSGTTLSAIQRIEQRLPSHSEMTLIRTFTLEDAIGRITRVDMVFVSSWDAFDAMLEGCFREFPGHKMVARKQYVFQDQKTNREIKRSIPWSGALVPGQYINMGLIFRKRSSKNKRFYCPYCHLALEQSQDGLIPCKCGMSHQRRTETMNVDEEEDPPTFDLPDTPFDDEDNISKLDGSLRSLTAQTQSVEAVDLGSQVEYEDMSSFKRVIVVEVEMNIVPSKTPVSESTTPQINTRTGYTRYPPYNTPPHAGYYPFSATPTPASGPSARHHSRNTSRDAYEYSPRGAFWPRYNSTGYYVRTNASRNKSSWSASASRQSERRNAFSHRASYADSDSDEHEYLDVLVDDMIYRMPRRPTRDTYNYRAGGRTAEHYYSQAQQYHYETEDPEALPEYDLPRPRTRRQSSSTPQSPNTTRPTNSPKKVPLTLKATEADARKHRIPGGYSLKNWDPTEEPIMLLGSVFDGNSLGKWIYDWAVYHHGAATEIADMAGELWLLLIQLVGKIKRAEECMPRIQKEENRDMVEDFIEIGERLLDKFKKLLKACETPMLRAGKTRKKMEQTAQVKTFESSPKTDENATLIAQFDKMLPAQTQNLGPSSTSSTMLLDPTLSSSRSSNDEVRIKEEHADVSGLKTEQILGKGAGIEFVNSIFGKDRQLEATEKFMASIRLWNLRFDANCEDILRNPLK